MKVFSDAGNTATAAVFARRLIETQPNQAVLTQVGLVLVLVLYSE